MDSISSQRRADAQLLHLSLSNSDSKVNAHDGLDPASRRTRRKAQRPPKQASNKASPNTQRYTPPSITHSLTFPAKLTVAFPLLRLPHPKTPPPRPLPVLPSAAQSFLPPYEQHHRPGRLPPAPARLPHDRHQSLLVGHLHEPRPARAQGPRKGAIIVLVAALDKRVTTRGADRRAQGCEAWHWRRHCDWRRRRKRRR